jgi:DNA-binding LacI/PurR family transcriptional regulator
MDIREIARRAKVSTATVSRTINHVPTVDPQLAKRVWKVVEELGYYPNTQARALVSGRSRIFGLIISEITNPFFPEIVQVFERIAVQHQYEILLTSTGHDPKRVETAVRRMIERRVDGVAVMTFGMEDFLLEDLKLRNVPLVFADVGLARPHVSNIRIDYLHGIRQAVQHLAAFRHQCHARGSRAQCRDSRISCAHGLLHNWHCQGGCLAFTCAARQTLPAKARSRCLLRATGRSETMSAMALFQVPCGTRVLRAVS